MKNRPIESIPYTTIPVTDETGLVDVRLSVAGKTWHMWGRNGVQRELDLAGSIADDTLPVLIGAGLGRCLEQLRAQGRPVVVIDREATIDETTEVREIYVDDPEVLWIDTPETDDACDALTGWQKTHGNKPFAPIRFPIYQRLDRQYYGSLAAFVERPPRDAFWAAARYPKFQSAQPRVLFIDSGYFLNGEILASLQRMDIPHRTLKLGDREKGSQTFIESLLAAVLEFKPDFMLTVNHFGLDREGNLSGLLEKLELPLASWFVDNPHLILYRYDHPGTDNTVIFTFDAGNLDHMRKAGFSHVHYLPLATDPARFRPGHPLKTPDNWRADISFVGNSMVTPVAKALANANLPPALAARYETVAQEFGQSGETGVMQFLERKHPDWAAAIEVMSTLEQKLATESLLTWEATRQYRMRCVSGILPFEPTIVGDTGWDSQIPSNIKWRALPPMDYYEDLPRFYPQSKINFNCTSQQMKGAVNQRIFDVPACGGFVLTDHREQMEDLFDLETEATVYRNQEEIQEIATRFLHDDKARKTIATNARKRILADHTYEKRMERLLSIMRSTFY